MISESTVKLVTSDLQTFEVTRDEAASIGRTIEDLMSDLGSDTRDIPLSNVKSPTLARMLEYCRKPRGEDEDDVAEFLRDYPNVDKKLNPAVYDFILAANFLNNERLLNISTKSVALRMKECDGAEDMRELLGIEDDFTPEEKEEVRRENAWAFA